MNCGKCGSKLNENQKYCGICGNYIQENTVIEKTINPVTKYDYIILSIACIAFVVSLIPINFVMIIGGIMLAAICIIGSIWYIKKAKNNVNIFSLIFSGCTFLVGLGWLYFYLVA